MDITLGTEQDNEVGIACQYFLTTGDSVIKRGALL